MESFVPLVAALALIWKLVDFAKQVRVRDVDAVITQLVTWGAGVVVTFILASSDFGDGILVAHSALGKLNGWSLVLVGLTIASTGSVGYDFKRALDATDSSAQPSLVSGVQPSTVQPVYVKTKKRQATT
jgi:hypothetical protein